MPGKDRSASRRREAGDHDLAILGGGSAAFAAARRASDLGARVLMVNRGPIGGTCVNVGCVPSKTLIRAAENHHQHGTSRFRGLKADPGRVDFPELVREKAELVAELRQAKYADVLAGLPNVQLVEGRARLASCHEVAVGASLYRAEKVLVATGARPSRPAVRGLDDPAVWDSAQAMEAAELPRRLVVLGGRYVALELGQMFARLGSRVTRVQRSEQILPDEDPDLAEALTGYLGQDGIEVRAGRELVSVARAGRGLAVEVRRAGRRERLEADAVLAALGRAANTEGIGLEALGVELGPRGTVVVGDDLQTSAAGIYAAGDVIGEPAYVYAAAYEGALAAENALTGTATPRPLSAVPRALAARDTRGLLKLLRAHGEDRLVGARILAPEGGEQIAEASLMLKFGLPVSAVARHFHAYLTPAIFASLRETGLEFDDQGNLVGAALTLRPSPHRFRVAGRDLFAWCSLDTLFLPGLLGETAEVASTCPVTGETIRLRVAPERVEEYAPATMVLSVVLPGISCSTTRTGPASSMCSQMFFFASRGAAETWVRAHPGVAVLSVEEAFELARQRFVEPARRAAG
jgi:mercuric reductase